MEFNFGKLAFQGILRNIVFIYVRVRTALDGFAVCGSPSARIIHTCQAQTCPKKILQSQFFYGIFPCNLIAFLKKISKFLWPSSSAPQCTQIR